MHKSSILDQITLAADGSVHMKFLKQIVDDDGTVISAIPHRAVAQPWEDPNTVMAFNCERLGLKHADVSQDDKDWVASIAPMRKKSSVKK